MAARHDDGASLRKRLLAHLSPARRSALSAIVAASGDAAVYAVGGAVRDLLLERPVTDVDLAVDGDAIAIAREAFRDAKIVVHPRFGTATAVIEKSRIDLAMTRRETYARPGALPTVEEAGIADDLRRRDLSVNAIALRLGGAAELLDPCDGRADIRERRIRVLHERSFIDDPTRIFRAVRYAARLGFEIEPRTAALLREATRYIEAVSGDRVRRELELVLREEAAGTALEGASNADALHAVHPALGWDRDRSRALGARPGDVPPLSFGFALLAADASPEQAEAAIARLRLRRFEAAAVRGVASMRRAGTMLRRRELKPSGVVVLLDRIPVASVAAFGGTSDDAIVRRMTLRYLDEWRYVKPALNGRDLQQLGVPEGPQVQLGLQLIRASKLDGWAEDRRDEEALALRFAKSIRDSGGAETARMERHLDGE